MKSQSRAKVGGRKGNPGYRTPSSFRIRKTLNKYFVKQNAH